MIICFLLPWISFLFSEVSGYQLQRLGGREIRLLWLIPITAAITVLAYLVKQSVAAASRVAGCLPWLALVFYLSKMGTDLFQALRICAYVTFFLGVLLLVAPHFLKKTELQTAASPPVSFRR